MNIKINVEGRVKELNQAQSQVIKRVASVLRMNGLTVDIIYEEDNMIKIPDYIYLSQTP